MISHSTLKINIILVHFKLRGYEALKKTKHFSIRLEEDTLKKFHYIAKYDDRTASGHIMYLIHKSIREFEKEHGEIVLADENKN